MNVVDEFYKDLTAKEYLNQKDNEEMKKIYHKFYASKILKLYFKNKLDNEIKKFYYKFKEKYQDEYNTLQGIDYSGENVQVDVFSDTTATRATRIVDLKFSSYLRYKYLLEAKKAVKRLLEGLNERQRNMLDFYFEYEDELEDACIQFAEDFKTGREEYKETKKLVRYCCNELDKMLL